MNKLMTVVAVAATILSAPAFAQSAPKHVKQQQQTGYQVPWDAVVVDGQVVGQDPDANIRTQIERDAMAGLGN
jgi:heat shock protein HslJ